MKRLILATLVLVLTMLTAVSALALEGESVWQGQTAMAMKTYDYPDWGLTISAPDGWLYQSGSLPPESNRPFRPATDTLSSRDTFYIGVWAKEASDLSPSVRLSAFYTSAGTVERIEAVKDKMMEMLVSRFSTADKAVTAGTFEALTCGQNRVACFSMTTTYQGVEYVQWNYLLPFPMTVVHLEGIAPIESDLDLKGILTDMAASLAYQ